MTYSILQRIEIDNLKHIVEGIRYNQPVSKIENTIDLCIGGEKWLRIHII